MQSLGTYAALAEHELLGMPDADAVGDLAVTSSVLMFCDTIGQLVIFGPAHDPVGFVAWLRFHPEHVALAREKNFDAIRQLDRWELTRGSVLCVAETWTRVPRMAAVAARELSKMPGVQRICAYVWGGTPPTRRWRERRIVRGPR